MLRANNGMTPAQRPRSPIESMDLERLVKLVIHSNLPTMNVVKAMNEILYRHIKSQVG